MTDNEPFIKIYLLDDDPDAVAQAHIPDSHVKRMTGRELIEGVNRSIACLQDLARTLAKTAQGPTH